tara:strand:+ start:119 stop:469 length:351 start_codon:yes stop_codon:yes gene_type:complete
MDIDKRVNNKEEIDECHICLELLEGELVKISCSHIFHYDCIKKWINKNKKNNKVCCICEKDTEIINIFYNMSQSIKNIPIQNDINANSYNTNSYQLIPQIEQEIIETKIWSCCNIL